MINYLFYIKTNPMGSSLKIGISAIKNLNSRVGSYQNSFGPDYEERLEIVWVGPEADVRELERLLKIKYRAKIAGNKRGLTEWIKGVPFEELVNDIENTIKGLGVDVIRPENFSKVFEADIDRLKGQFLIEEIAD